MGRKIYGGRSAARQQTLKIPDKPSFSAKTGYGGGSGAGMPPCSLRFHLHWGKRPPVGRRRTGINPFRPFRCVPPGCPASLACGVGRTAETEGGRRIPPEITDAVSDGCFRMRSRAAQDRRPARPPKVLPEMRQRRKIRIVRPLIRGCAEKKRRWPPTPEDGPEI